MKKQKGPKPWTQESLDLLWRDGDPDFIGAVGPPMKLWLVAGCPCDPWMSENHKALYAKEEPEIDEKPVRIDDLFG